VPVPPSPTYLDKSKVEDLAQRFSEVLGFRPGDDIRGVVAKLGGEVVFGSTGHEDIESGSLIARSRNDFRIFLSALTSFERDRFTIAHEIGHLILHWDVTQKKNPGAIMRATRFIDPSSEIQKRAEWEANWFAAELLMPKKDFIESLPSDITELQRKYDVSAAAIQARAKALGVIGQVR